MSPRPLRLHWASSKPNFGDQLSPLLCARLSGRPIQHASPRRCDLMAAGSLLHRLSESWLGRRVHVWGTGYLEPVPPHPSRHHYHALRGKLSQALITNARPQALGDPGLLCHLLLNPDPPPPKPFLIGIVCHYKDKGHPLVQSLLAQHPHATEIDVFLPPLELLQALRQCEVIFSSAMHPLIAADALEIPNAWIRLSDQVRGQDFKFRDYYSVFGFEDVHPLTLDAHLLDQSYREVIAAYCRPNLHALQHALLQAFPFPAPAPIS